MTTKPRISKPRVRGSNPLGRANKSTVFKNFRKTKLYLSSRCPDGKWSLLFAWLPIVGDPLTFVAGTMRIRFLNFLILVAIGKVGRYLVVMAATDWSLNLF